MTAEMHRDPMIASSVMGPTAHRAFATSILVTAALALWYGYEWLQRLSFDSALPIAVGLLAGIVTADLLTGLIHWACDTWGDEETMLVGPSLIYFFREHHRDPEAMLDRDWIEVNGHAALLATGAFALLATGQERFAIQPQPPVQAWLWSTICCSAITNQIHYWSHMSHPPAFVRALQNARIILARGQHAIHHRAPHTDGYCITTGWMNGTLDTLQFWRMLERIIEIATKAVPRSVEGIGSQAAIQRSPTLNRRNVRHSRLEHRDQNRIV